MKTATKLTTIGNGPVRVSIYETDSGFIVRAENAAGKKLPHTELGEFAEKTPVENYIRAMGNIEAIVADLTVRG